MKISGSDETSVVQIKKWRINDVNTHFHNKEVGGRGNAGRSVIFVD